MKTQVEFYSDKFPPYDGEEEQINPGLWGKRLAEYLQQRLKERGILTRDPVAEDWGWVLPVENNSFDLWIGCGHQNGDDHEFLCFIEPSTPVIRRFFKKIDTTDAVRRVADAMNKILSSDLDIRNVRWSEKDGKTVSP